MKRRETMRRLLWLLVGSVALAGLFWAIWPKPVAVDTTVISRGRLAAAVSAEGKTRVKHLYEVSAPVDGTLERITVQPGDPVTPDTTVARIAPIASRPLDPRTRAEAEAAVAAAHAAVNRVDAAERAARVAAEHADSQLETARNLVERGATPRNEAVHAGHEAELRKRVLEEAHAAARQARADLARASAVVSTTSGMSVGVAVEVKPPAPGRILRIVRESGGPVAAGTPLVEIGEITQLEIVTDLLSSDAAEVEPGASATITGWGGAPLGARVRRVDPAGFTKVSALGLEEQRVRVILDLIDAPPSSLGHDFRVDARVIVWERNDVLRVPSTALFRHGEHWAVYAARHGRAHLVTVEVGRSDGTWTVIERGLTSGEVVVIQPSDQVGDGTRVRDKGST